MNTMMIYFQTPSPAMFRKSLLKHEIFAQHLLGFVTIYRSDDTSAEEFNTLFEEFCDEHVLKLIFQRHETVKLTNLLKSLQNFGKERNIDLSSYK